MAERRLPISPRSTSNLEIGDLIAVPLPSGRWGCLQITDLKKTGVGARTALVVGVLPWVGSEPPTAQNAAGLTVQEQALTGIEIFTEAGLEVVDTVELSPSGLPSNFRDSEAGTVHKAWGWKTVIGRVAALDV